MKRKVIGVIAVIGAACVAIGYGIGRAGAYGVPTTSTLSYSGTLLTFGQPDNSTHSMSIALWVPNGASPVCSSSSPSSITVQNGQFTIPMPAQCVSAIHQNPNLQVEVTIDSSPMGLQPLAAVPYALEAGAVAGSPLIANVGLTATTASNALTVNLVQADGQSTPSLTNPGIIGFRSLTPASGALTPLQVTSMLALTVPQGATLGQASGTAQHTYVYAQDNSSNVQVCVSTAGYLDEGSLQTSLTIGASSTSATALYCSAAATGPVRLIGRLLSSQTTAGTWASAPTEVALPPFGASGRVAQIVSTVDTGQYSGTGASFAELTPNWRLSITPTNAASKLLLTATFGVNIQGTLYYVRHFEFFDVLNSLAVGVGAPGVGNRVPLTIPLRGPVYDTNDSVPVTMQAVIPAGGTATRTFTIYWDAENGGQTTCFNYSCTDQTGASPFSWTSPFVFTISELAP